jgi:hypothetical protein
VSRCQSKIDGPQFEAWEEITTIKIGKALKYVCHWVVLVMFGYMFRHIIIIIIRVQVVVDPSVIVMSECVGKGLGVLN